MLHLPFSRTITATMENYLYNKKFEVDCKKNKWIFSNYRKAMIKSETLDWEKNYLPINIKDKVILDVGAGEGETAKFFIEHGAKGVYCVESSKQCYNNLIQNSFTHDLSPIFASFHPDMLSIGYDFAKIDIEGYEETLLITDSPDKPMVVEVHGLQQLEKFRRKGFRIQQNINPYGCVAYAYWRC